MKLTNFRCFFLAFLILLPVLTFAQEEGDEDKYKNIPKRSRDQKDQYDDGDYLFPPKPKNNWSLGLRGGLLFIGGDVAPKPGFNIALSARKAIGHAFSLRGELSYGSVKGQNYKPTWGYRNHSSTPWDSIYFKGNVNQIDGSGAPPEVYYNYKMTYFDGAIHALFNLNNINFYKEQVRWNLYLGAGLGVNAYNTVLDAKGSGGDPYDFSSISQIPLNDGSGGTSGKKDRLNALKSLMDGEYETQAESHNDRGSLKLGDKTYSLLPFVSGLVGFRYRVNRRLELDIEYKGTFTGDDLLDGQRWSESGSGGNWVGSMTPLSSTWDIIQTITLGIHFRIGKSEDALWWSNPLKTVYSDAREARMVVDKLTQDTDDDGVPDLYDKEPDTPEGYPVDVRGVTMDSDGDGYPEPVDDEPFSPKGADVDERGVALDSDNDGVPDVYDKEPNSPAGMYYDANGVAIVMPTGLGDAEAPCLLPIVYFGLDSDQVGPEFYPELYYIAELMKANESLKVRAVGHSDSRASAAYNEDLSRRRVTNVVNFVVNTYKIDPARFVVQYAGERELVIPDLPDNKANKKLEALHYVNRRVEFVCIQE